MTFVILNHDVTSFGIIIKISCFLSRRAHFFFIGSTIIVAAGSSEEGFPNCLLLTADICDRDILRLYAGSFRVIAIRHAGLKSRVNRHAYRAKHISEQKPQ